METRSAIGSGGQHVIPMPHSESWQIQNSEVKAVRAGATVLVYVFKGRMLPDFVPHIRAAAAPIVASGKHVDLFFDTEAMAGFDTDFRVQMTAWHEELRHVTRYAGVLVKSRVVQMAISVANIVTGGKMVSYSNRAAFEAAIQKAVTE